MARTPKSPKGSWQQANQAMKQMRLEAILAEADVLFSRKGYAATSLDEVASRLSISKTALYHYVQNKNMLLQLCYERALERTQEYYAQAEEQGRNGLDKLVTYLRLDARGGVISMTPLTELEALKDTKARKKLAAGIEGCERTFQGFVEEGIADGSIAECDPQMVTQFIIGASRSMMNWYDPDADHDLVGIVEKFIGFCQRGLLPR